MMKSLCEERDGIFRIRIPFHQIFTSVFCIEADVGKILVDCGSTADDVDCRIVPALEAIGCTLQDVRMLVLTHRHGDHAGGLHRLLSLAPHLEVITEVCVLCEGISTYPLAGHTADSIGVLDGRTGTLISGDGLQGAGVDKYRCALKLPEAYLETLDRIREDERIENILFSHAYEPWNTDGVFGQEKVYDCLTKCEFYGKR